MKHYAPNIALFPIGINFKKAFLGKGGGRADLNQELKTTFKQIDAGVGRI